MESERITTGTPKQSMLINSKQYYSSYSCNYRFKHELFFSQELDYGALYEVRTPHFYVEANKMPTARVSDTVCAIDLQFNTCIKANKRKKK